MVRKIVDFLLRYMDYAWYLEGELQEAVDKHFEYGTYDYKEDAKGLIYYMRFDLDNINMRVFDLCVREDHRGINNLKRIIARNWDRFPNLQTFEFKRGQRSEVWHKHRIEQFLNK